MSSGPISGPDGPVPGSSKHCPVSVQSFEALRTTDVEYIDPTVPFGSGDDLGAAPVTFRVEGALSNGGSEDCNVRYRVLGREETGAYDEKLTGFTGFTGTALGTGVSAVNDEQMGYAEFEVLVPAKSTVPISGTVEMHEGNVAGQHGPADVNSNSLYDIRFRVYEVVSTDGTVYQQVDDTVIDNPWRQELANGVLRVDGSVDPTYSIHPGCTHRSGPGMVVIGSTDPVEGSGNEAGPVTHYVGDLWARSQGLFHGDAAYRTDKLTVLGGVWARDGYSRNKGMYIARETHASLNDLHDSANQNYVTTSLHEQSGFAVTHAAGGIAGAQKGFTIRTNIPIAEYTAPAPTAQYHLNIQLEGQMRNRASFRNEGYTVSYERGPFGMNIHLGFTGAGFNNPNGWTAVSIDGSAFSPKYVLPAVWNDPESGEDKIVLWFPIDDTEVANGFWGYTWARSYNLPNNQVNFHRHKAWRSVNQTRAEFEAEVLNTYTNELVELFPKNSFGHIAARYDVAIIEGQFLSVPGQTTIATPSDENLKTIHEDIDVVAECRERALKWTPRAWTYNDQIPQNAGRKGVGMTAQEYAEIYPDHVHTIGVESEEISFRDFIIEQGKDPDSLTEKQVASMRKKLAKKKISETGGNLFVDHSPQLHDALVLVPHLLRKVEELEAKLGA